MGIIHLMKKIRTEHILYLLALLLALGLRLLNLGKAPLSDFEADWALQSMALARGESVNLGALPGYIFPTTLLFYLFESTNFMARLWPALAGSFLVLAPFAFRDRLGQKAALIIAFGLALDPGMVALSRLAGGPMLAIAFTILALALLYAGQSAWGGVTVGLALLSGPMVITGLLGVGITLGLARLMGFWHNEESPLDGEASQNPPRSTETDWRRVLIFGGGTFLVVATLFLRFPQGLGAWATTFSAYSQNWFVAPQIPAGRLLAAIFFYAVLALVFGLVAAIRGWAQRQNTARALSIWLLIALMLPMLMPGRQVSDVAWVLLPLWALAGMELARYAYWSEKGLISLAQAAAVVVLLVIIWLTLAALSSATPEAVQSYWIVAGAAVMIGVLVTLLVYFGWSWQVARNGLVWGMFIGLGTYCLASVFGISQVRPSSPQEWWMPVPTTRYADLLEITLKDLALSQTGNADFLEVVSTVEAPSLQWVLRDITGVSYVDSLDSDTTPSIVITRADDYSGLRQDLYRGQDFGWWDFPGWGGALPWEPIKWLTSREAVVVTEDVIVWVRLDLFPDDPVLSAEQQEAEFEVDESSPPSGEGVEIEE